MPHQRIVELDGLRGLAVSLVVLSHVQSLLPGGRFPGPLAPLDVLASGALGVLIFFVLSGYLITSLLLAEHARMGTVAIGAFYARRATRIFPWTCPGKVESFPDMKGELDDEATTVYAGV